MEDSYDIHTCPSCGVKNFVCNGNLEDMTSTLGEDPACICWNCDLKFWRGDPNDEGFRDGIYDYDPDKTTEENLKEVGAELGSPNQDYNSREFEIFLDEESLVAGKTWRGYFLAELAKLNDGKSIWDERRVKRMEIVAEYVRDPRQPDSRQIADAFNKERNGDHFWGLICQTYRQDEKTSRNVVDGVDWQSYDRRFKALIEYMMQL